MPPVSMKKVDIFSALCVIPICIYVFYESGRWPMLPDLGNPAWIPRGVAAVLLGAALLLLRQGAQGGSLTLPARLEGADRTRVLWVAVLTGAYVFGHRAPGIHDGDRPLPVRLQPGLGERRWARLALFAIVVPVATYLLFNTALNVPLPRGLFR